MPRYHRKTISAFWRPWRLTFQWVTWPWPRPLSQGGKLSFVALPLSTFLPTMSCSPVDHCCQPASKAVRSFTKYVRKFGNGWMNEWEYYASISWRWHKHETSTTFSALACNASRGKNANRLCVVWSTCITCCSLYQLYRMYVADKKLSCRREAARCFMSICS